MFYAPRRFLPITQEGNEERVIETPHNYDNGMDKYWNLEFDGAEEIVIEFDPRCRTEHGCDYLRFYKDS